jgi:hypothetical protein
MYENWVSTSHIQEKKIVCVRHSTFMLNHCLMKEVTIAVITVTDAAKITVNSVKCFWILITENLKYSEDI